MLHMTISRQAGLENAAGLSANPLVQIHPPHNEHQLLEMHSAIETKHRLD